MLALQAITDGTSGGADLNAATARDALMGQGIGTAAAVLDLATSNIAVAQVLPGVTSLAIGLGWDLRQPAGPQTDVVPAVIACGADGKALSAEHVAFFNQLEVADGTVRVQDAARDGAGGLDGDDERVVVDLPAVPPESTRSPSCST